MRKIEIGNPVIKTVINLPVLSSGIVGVINLETGEIKVNPQFSINFQCQITGDCCRRHQIPVLGHEVKRLKAEGHDNFISDLPPIETLEGNTYWMKRVEDSCVFLKNKKCSIHDYKPFSCKLFPFQVVAIDDMKFEVIVPNQNTCQGIISSTTGNEANSEHLKYILSLMRKNEVII